MKTSIARLILLGLWLASFPATLWSQNVAPTDPLDAEQQQARFHLPAGFEIQLVVSDPDIGQPMNLNFDARGRLWISHSVEYPYPAAGDGVQPRDERFGAAGSDPPRDRLTIVQRMGSDGRASEITHFADGLNIPIGQTPLGDGRRALVYSIPGIYLCQDDDSDGRSDRRRMILGRFGNVDTHGMSSSYTRWIDGWIYGCHGFANQSEIRDGSGQVTRLHSGNTYRFLEDGSNFQQFTWGQVNPFGMAFDPWGNLYDADCHSMPVYLLLRGARYPHFGSQPDELGFGPTMIDHNHGSTGICGPAYYAADHFPDEYRDNLFICNPVTGRVHRDSLERFGSTNMVRTLPDFIRCDDPWFRPVDAKLGPDGALYVADFYNSIIGHYEVPLDHPRRDRRLGRVWRIVYRGPRGENPSPPAMPDLTQLDLDRLVDQLGSPNLLVRTLATNYLVDAHHPHAAEAVRGSWQRSAYHRAHGLWVLERLGTLDQELLHRLVHDREALVRVHAVRALAERERWVDAVLELVQQALGDDHAIVRRVAADALGRHPRATNIPLLLQAWREADPRDTHLVHMIRIALRDHFEDGDVVGQLVDQPLADDLLDRQRLLEMASAARGEMAAAYLIRHAQPGEFDQALLDRVVPALVRQASLAQIERLVDKLRSTLATEVNRQVAVFLLVHDGLVRRGVQPSQQPGMQHWMRDLAPRAVASLSQGDPSRWTNQDVSGLPPSPSPWGIRQRACTDGQAWPMIDSIVNGEQLTGAYHSSEFSIPGELSFWMCGHNGFLGTNPTPVNQIQLRRLDTDQIVARDIPPRNDTARRYVWDLRLHAGKPGRLEIIDGDTHDAYAWIGVGRFQPAVVSVPEPGQPDRDRQLLELIGAYGVNGFSAQLLQIFNDTQQSAAIRAAAAGAILEVAGAEAIAGPLVEALLRGTESDRFRGEVAQLLAEVPTPDTRQALLNTVALASATLQRDAALALCTSRDGAEGLLQSIQSGKSSPRLLQDPLIQQRFQQHATPSMKQDALALLEMLPSVEDSILQLITTRRRQFDPRQASAERGVAVYKQHCAACHQLNGQGTVIGPQLDGIGQRGLDRLLEDVIDPNRNVDVAFRVSEVTTMQGKIVVGLHRRREGNVLVLADSQGKELQIPDADIDEIRGSSLSLMPANFGQLLTGQQLHDLLAFLLSQRTD